MSRWRFAVDDRAVSPVIGTILLVALTVVIVTTVSVFAFGLGFSETVCNVDLEDAQSILDPVC